MDRKRIAMLAGVGVAAAMVLALIVTVILHWTGAVALPFWGAEETKVAYETTQTPNTGTEVAKMNTAAEESSEEDRTDIDLSRSTEVSTEATEESTEEETTSEESTEDTTEESTEEETEEETTSKEPPTYRFVEPVLNLEVGEQQMSGLVCSDPTAPPVPVYFSSADPSIADVVEAMVVAKSAGITTITAKLAGQEISCQVQVHEPTLMVYINYSNLNMLPGDKKQLAVGVEPADTKQNIALTWQSSNAKVASVDKNGVVTAKNSGAARIVGHIGTKYEVYCDVIVEAKLEVLAFAEGNVTMQPGETKLLPVACAPVEATIGKVIYFQSSKPEVATIDQGGNVHAISPGNTTVAVFVGEEYAVCVVTVKEPPTQAPTEPPTQAPTEPPTQAPTEPPTQAPTQAPETEPSGAEESSAESLPIEETLTEAPTEPPTEPPTPEETLPVETVEATTEEVVETAEVSTEESVEATEPETDPIPDVPVPPAPQVTLVFDAGHGGKWVGSASGAGNYLRTPQGQLEKDLTLQVALMAKAYIEEHYEGVTIIMTRTTDTHFSTDQVEDLKLRCAIAKQYNATAMISFHFNAITNHSASGATVLCSRKASVAAASAGLANCILDELELLGIGRRGIATKLLDNSDLDYYAINRHCAAYDIPGIVVENCFYDNPAEVPFFDSHDALMRLAIADVKGIAKYYGLREK